MEPDSIHFRIRPVTTSPPFTRRQRMRLRLSRASFTRCLIFKLRPSLAGQGEAYIFFRGSLRRRRLCSRYCSNTSDLAHRVRENQSRGRLAILNSRRKLRCQLTGPQEREDHRETLCSVGEGSAGTARSERSQGLECTRYGQQNGKTQITEAREKRLTFRSFSVEL